MTDRESTGGAILIDPLGGLLLAPSNELRFKGPFDDYVTVSLTITNPTEKRIAFKIKTTAPKRYCVKPNSGVLDPAQQMKVNVLLQPFVYDPNEKNKHKFMVQYMYLNDVEIQMSVNDILNMWKDVDNKRLLDLKLKCIFDYTEGDVAGKAAAPTAAAAATTGRDSLQSSNETTMYSAVDTSKRESLAPSTQIQSPVSPTQTIPSTVPESDKQQQLLNDFESKSSNNSTKVNTNNSNNNNSRQQQQNSDNNNKNDNLSNELKLAHRDNEALKIEVANLREAEIRLRKLALSSATTPKQTANINNKHHPSNLVDLLQNKLVLVIAILIAIIFYLLLFR